MSGQQYHPLSFFMILGLLALAPPETINKTLESLSFALNTTSKSVDSLKKGMDTFHTGLQHLSLSVTGASNDLHYNWNANTGGKHEIDASIMPANAPGRGEEKKGANRPDPPEE